MKTLFLSTVFLLLISGSLLGQCPTGDVTFESQEDIDQFFLLHPTCTTINGNLRIHKDVSDVTQLSGLSTITGTLIIDETELVDLDGLNNINSLGSLSIVNNSLLESISALSNFIPANEEEFILEINRNSSIEDLTGLENITGAKNIIINNNSLLNLDALNNLTIVYHSFQMYGNVYLVNIHGLSGLEEVRGSGQPDGSGSLDIRFNYSLESLQGLNNLKKLNILLLERNILLPDLQGLENLTECNLLAVAFSSAMTTLQGIGKISNLESLLLWENENLSMCAVPAVCRFLNRDLEGRDNISENADGCNGRDQILAECIALPVKLKNFTADLKENIVTLSWVTTEEVNSSYFEVELSNDGKNWKTIGRVEALGTTNELKEYVYHSNYEVLNKDYYRLRMVDLDGSYNYSPIRSVSDPSASFVIFPNPVSDIAQIKGVDHSTIIKYQVTSLNGKMITESDYNPINGIDVTNITPGVYVLTLIDLNGISIVRRIVKR